MNTIYKALLMLLLVSVAYALNYSVNVMLAHLLSAKAYGNFSVIKEVMMLGSMLLLQGANFSVLKFIPEYNKSKKYQLIRGYLTYNAKVFILTSIFLLIVALLMLFVKDIIFWAIILTILFTAVTFYAELLRSLQHVFFGTYLSDLLAPLFLALILYCFKSIGFITVLGIYAIVLSAIIVGGVLLAWRYLPKQVFKTSAKYTVRLWQRCSRELMASKFVLTLLFSSEIIILKIFGSHGSDVGIFGAILTVGSLYWLLFNAVNYVLSPLISPLVYSKDKKKLRELFKGCSLLLLFLAGSLTIALIYYRVPILHYFSPEFTRGALSYSIVMSGFAVTVILGLPWYFIGLSGQQQLLVKPVLIVAILSIIYTAILSHYYHLLGAAIGLAATDVIMGVWLTLILYKLKLF